MERKKLGEGGFGKVFLVKELSAGNYFAAKYIDKSKLKNPQNAIHELHTMRTLNHPNIIKLYDAIEVWGNEGNDSIYLFMEYATGGDLQNYINGNVITLKAAKDIFRQIVSGVEYLHSKGTAHRDLKPQNIVLNLKPSACPEIKIADFGLAKKFENDDELLSRCGTLGYATRGYGTRKYQAPEVASGAAYNGCKADMYSLGMIFKDITTEFGKKEMPSECKALFKKLTSNNPSSRPSATEVLEDPILNFMKDADVRKLFAVDKKIGEGGFGEVYLAKEQSSQKRGVLKIISKCRFTDPEIARREIDNMRSLRHPNIINLFHSMETDDSIYLFMEYAPGGDLHSYIKENDTFEFRAKRLFREIVRGVEYLHSKGLVHRDLKPANILIDREGVIRIADFGISKKFENNDEMVTSWGTPRYRAPEVSDENIPRYSGRKADMFSLCKILEDLATKYGKQKMSSSCEALYKKLTSKNPSFRPTTSEVLNDPWLA